MTPSNQARAASTPHPLSLRRNFSWTLTGNVVYAASQWGMLVVIARLGTPEMVGQFALGLAVTAPIIMFTNMALRQVQATDAQQEYTFPEYFGLRIISVLLALAVITAIALIAYRAEAAWAILLMGIAKAFEALSDVVYGLLQQHERMDRIAQSMMIKGPVSLVAVAAGVVLSNNIIGGVIGLALVWGLLFILYDLSGIRFLGGLSIDMRPAWKPQRLRQLTWLTLPLGFVMMLNSLNVNIPRYFVERYMGEAQLGIYSAMAYLIVAGSTVVNALGQAASPRLATYYARNDKRAYRGLLLRLQGIGAGMGVLGIILALLAGESILDLLYGREYATEASVFVWIMVAAALNYLGSCLSYGVTAARVFKLQLILSGFPTVVALGLSATFIPRGELLNAASVLIVINFVSYAIVLMAVLWIVKNMLPSSLQNEDS